MLSLIRLLLPHHWLWRCLSMEARYAQEALDDRVNAARTWAETEPETHTFTLAYWASSPVLELGAGSGQITRELVQGGRRVTAIEPSALLCAAGRKAVSAAQWVEANWRADVVFDNWYRSVVIAHALHHIADRDAVARFVNRKLCDGGHWILLEPRHDWRRVAHLIKSWWLDLRHMPWEEYGATHHFLTRGEVRHIAKAGGFSIIAENPTPRATWWVLEKL